MRDRWRVVAIAGPRRLRKQLYYGADGDDARHIFNVAAAKARPDTQIRLYRGDAVHCVTGGDPDTDKSNGQLTEKQLREAVRSTGDE